MNEITSTEILNDIESEKISLFNEDTIMKEAVRKVLLRGIYQNGTLKKGEHSNPKQNFMLAIANNPQLSNEEIGAEARAAYWGITILEQAFDKLSEIKRPNTKEEIISNPAE